MVDTVHFPMHGGDFPDAAAQRLASADPASHDLPITFSGSGSEYFRIWIVNVLLTCVTLGAYFPWAKVRRLRYFYGNTAIGEHTLDFHGNPMRMLRGYLLVGAMVVLYSVAGQMSAMAGLIAFVIVALVWPALFRASQQFRMANTSWRGLRFRFAGDLQGAYLAMLPLFIPGALMLLAVPLASEGDAPDSIGALGSAVGLAAALLFPLALFLLKKYQHDHYAVGQIQTQLRAGAGSFYMLALKTVGVGLIAAVVAIGGAATIAGVGSLATLFGGNLSRGGAAVVIALVVAVFLAYAGVLLVVAPYVTSRMQDLVWGSTQSPLVRFESNLRFAPLFWLTLTNWLLTIVTLGLYWPFARIALAKMRLQAVTVQVMLSPDELVSAVRELADDNAGDAAGDFFGIDIGL
jgi:uncharacterized membrane protein YjgN (DUF898 family)